MSRIAVVVTCHAAYLDWLPDALRGIDEQQPAADERVVVFDGVEPSPLPKPWRAIAGTWGHPSEARNAGLWATTSPWVIFWDADNVMPEGYLAAMQAATSAAPGETAIVYPDIRYCDARLAPVRDWRVPDWSYWDLRADNYIDTASAWRRAALEMVAGWSTRTRAFEDFALALDVTALGWTAIRLDGPPVMMRVHDESWHRRQTESDAGFTSLWRARSLAIVSLLAGRDDLLDGWIQFMLRAELPDKTALYVVDNSQNDDFHERVHSACLRIASVRDLTHVDLCVVGRPYQPAVPEPYLTKSRHLHVARLYADVIARVTEDVVLTLEDDVEPPLDAVRRMGAALGYRSIRNVGAVASAYAMSTNPDLVCAALGADRWEKPVTWGRLPAGLSEVGFVGGGCTIWANWAIRSRPIQLDWDQQLGWDAMLSRELRRAGYCLQLHGDVRSLHHHQFRPEKVSQTAPPPERSVSTEVARSLLPRWWQQSFSGEGDARSHWQLTEGGDWGWSPRGLRVRGSGSEWAGYQWNLCSQQLLRDLGNVAIEISVSGVASAAGLSFGPYKDFVTDLDPRLGTHRLRFEVDADRGRWRFLIDGVEARRQWWNSNVQSLADVHDGVLTFKAREPTDVIFHDLLVEPMSSACQLSVVMTCNRFLQRLRIGLRNWCHQQLSPGRYELVIANPHSPDGTHEHLAAAADSYPNLTIREVLVDAALSHDKGSLVNQAVEASIGEWIWLTDADCVFGPRAAADVLPHLGNEQHIYFGERRRLTADETNALLAGRLDSVRDFEELHGAAADRQIDRKPWGYTQIVHRSVLERIRYREALNHFAHSDEIFVKECKRQRITPRQVPGLSCLHLDHPFAWYGTELFL
jgi:glycosyltransferase involved in cell wall biosynthesis